MSEVELEPDRNRLHDLVRLVWQTAQPSEAVDGSAAPTGGTPVTDQSIADAGPYSVDQVRAHLIAEQEGTYVLDQDGDTVRVLAVRDA
jgi:hypothetical protein